MNKSLHVTGVVNECPYCHHIDHISIHMDMESTTEFDIKPIVYVTCSNCTRQTIINIALARNEYEEEFVDIIQKYCDATGEFDFENAGMELKDGRCFGIEFPKEVYKKLKYTIPEGWSFIPVDGKDTYYIGTMLPTVDPIVCDMYGQLISWAEEYFAVKE